MVPSEGGHQEGGPQEREPDDGGPAFPAEGMSLRDFFAGMVLAGMAAGISSAAAAGRAPKTSQQIAQGAYEMADIMLVARRESSGSSKSRTQSR